MADIPYNGETLQVIVGDKTNFSAVKPASTAAITSDPALVVSISPNTPLVTMSDKSGTGSISALNGVVTAIINGCGTIQFNVTGTWVATMTIEGLVNTIWIPISGDIDASDTVISTFSVNSLVTVNSGGFTQVRIRASAYTSGTATVDWNAGAGVALVEVFNANGNQLKVKDVLDTSAQNRAQSVTTSAAEALGAGTILINRKLLHITPTNGTIYWGYTSGVTTTTGTPLFPNNTLWLSVTDNIHVFIIASTTIDTRIGELS